MTINKTEPTLEEVNRILLLTRRGLSQKEISKIFGLSRSRVSQNSECEELHLLMEQCAKIWQEHANWFFQNE